VDIGQSLLTYGTCQKICWYCIFSLFLGALRGWGPSAWNHLNPLYNYATGLATAADPRSYLLFSYAATATQRVDTELYL